MPDDEEKMKYLIEKYKDTYPHLVDIIIEKVNNSKNQDETTKGQDE